MQRHGVFARFTLASAAIAVLFAVAAIFALPALAFESSEAFVGVLDSEVNADFDEFRIPDHRWRVGSFGLSGSGWSSSEKREAFNARRSDYSGEIQGSFGWRRDSDRRAQAVTVSGSLGGARSRLRTRRAPDDQFDVRVESRGRYESDRVDERWSLDLSTREYPRWIDPVGIQTSLAVGARYFQNWRAIAEHVHDRAFGGQFREMITNENREIWFYSHDVVASIRLGLGRVRDASGVYQARLLEDRLRRDGRLAAPLTNQARYALARLFYLGPESNQAFRVVHDEPEKAFWREVERILVDSGSLDPHRFDAYDLIHATERVVVAEGRFYRPKGVFAGPIFRSANLHSIERSDEHLRRQTWLNRDLASDIDEKTHERISRSEDLVAAGIALEWHRPIGLRTQIDLATFAVGDLDGLDVERSWDTDADLRYLLGERWFLELRLDHTITVREDSDNFREWNAAASTLLRYYLEDRLNFDVQFTTRQNSTHGVQRSRTTDFHVGMGYEIGRMWAPGLIEPVVSLN